MTQQPEDKPERGIQNDYTAHTRKMAQRMVNRYESEYPERERPEPSEALCVAYAYLKATAAVPELGAPTKLSMEQHRRAWHRRLGEDGHSLCPTERECVAFDEGFKAAMSGAVSGCGERRDLAIEEFIRTVAGPAFTREEVAQEAKAIIAEVPPYTRSASQPLANRADRQHTLDMVRGFRETLKRSPGLGVAPFSDDGWRIVEQALTEAVSTSGTPQQISSSEKPNNSFDYGKAYADLFDLINSDSMAVTFQSLGQYRAWLLQSIRSACPDAPAGVPSAIGDRRS